MIQQPDKNYFENAMHEEFSAMFTNDIWEKVSKRLMYSYYNELRKSGKGVKRQ